MTDENPSRQQPFATKRQYQDAVRSLEAAAKAYYDSEELDMDDAAYDMLVGRVAATETKNPAWGSSSVTTAVAAGVSAGGDVLHSAPMLSLDNAFDDNELTAWFERLERAAAVTSPALCVEPKLDGLALAARYVAGKLDCVLTRGDGATGEDVTKRAMAAVGLPAELAERIDIEIRGECVMTVEQFDQANALRVGDGKSSFANPRNAVAGCIRNQSAAWTAPMTFCAYSVVGPQADEMSHTQLMGWLESLGVNTAIAMGRQFGAGAHSDIQAAIKACTDIAANRADLDCGIDGAVVKADDIAVRSSAGATGKAPRWAVARKFPADTRMTVLVDIETSVGRTGALTLRAWLEPVAVGGVVIRHCTLSNPSEIARKDLRIGDTVWVRRAGEVIPEITGPNTAVRPKEAMPWVAPADCPRCGSTLDRTQKVWRCPQGRNCGLAESIDYACSRDALDIEGMGSKLVAQLAEQQIVADVADVFALTVADLAPLDRMGEQSAANVIAQIDKAKAAPLSRVLTALGIQKTGRRMCRRMASHFLTMDAVRNAGVEELAEIEGIGEVRAAHIVNELAELADVIERLQAAGVNMVEPRSETAAGGPLKGMKVCVTGSVPGFTREGAQQLVETLGGTFVSSVSKKTDLLVVGDGGGSKAKKAAELGVETMTGEAFAALA